MKIKFNEFLKEQLLNENYEFTQLVKKIEIPDYEEGTVCKNGHSLTKVQANLLRDWIESYVDYVMKVKEVMNVTPVVDRPNVRFSLSEEERICGTLENEIAENHGKDLNEEFDFIADKIDEYYGFNDYDPEQHLR